MKTGKVARFMVRLSKEKYLHFMVLPAIIWLIIFCYMPIGGLQIAFKNYRFDNGILGSQWAGFKYFLELFQDPFVKGVLINTLKMSLAKLVIMIPCTLMFAIMLDEIAKRKAKRVYQTISYFPYFISWPIVFAIVTTWFSPTHGIVNEVMIKLGIIEDGIFFLGDSSKFLPMMVSLEVWKNIGWGAIIYLAAMSSINPELYESAAIDGASRMARIFHITIPSILPTVMMMLILNISHMLSGGMFSSNFQQSYLFGNVLNSDVSEILETYILRMGISLARFPYAAAVGMVTGLVSLLLLGCANFISGKLTQIKLF